MESDPKRWVIKKQLGRGLCGTVFQASRADVPAQKVAVKYMDVRHLRTVYKAFDVTTEELAQTLYKEIEILSRLQHVNIVRLEEWFHVTQFSIAICMELVKGRDLLELVPSGGMSEEIARFFFVQVCEAVTYCHSRQVIHGDLKPENVLVTREGRIKLIDFGFSHIYEKGKSLKVIGGTKLYSPPCDDTITFAWDYWAGGVLLFVLLFGRLPFTVAELTATPLNLRVKATLSPDFLKIFQGLWKIDKEQRSSFTEVERNSQWLKGEKEERREKREKRKEERC